MAKKQLSFAQKAAKKKGKSENINIEKVKTAEAIATHSLLLKMEYVSAPTPAAPTTFAMVLSVRIAAKGRLIFSLNDSSIFPLFLCSFIIIAMCVRGIDKIVDSNKEHKNETIIARRK